MRRILAGGVALGLAALLVSGASHGTGGAPAGAANPVDFTGTWRIEAPTQQSTTAVGLPNQLRITQTSDHMTVFDSTGAIVEEVTMAAGPGRHSSMRASDSTAIRPDSSAVRPARTLPRPGRWVGEMLQVDLGEGTIQIWALAAGDLVVRLEGRRASPRQIPALESTYRKVRD